MKNGNFGGKFSYFRPQTGRGFITDKYTTEVFGKAFQIIGQVVTKEVKIQYFYINTGDINSFLDFKIENGIGVTCRDASASKNT